ncbi:Short-chain dehydrogenase/reductase SDR [Macleaya cordata]|uniref:Secoisolariciresinol dehydrogenase n=1 Tax=Macleaya cordata TaxID=56857 RepID=A0A200QZZ9_MACCD|nr:Short-chain dehydrogenase/reductase SDR [Macleaya cordata]
MSRGSGIGEAAARLFVENGAFVVVVDVQDELGEKVVASIGPEKVCYKHCDVRDEKQVEETVAYALEKYGTLDIVYSNAGIIGSYKGILNLDMASLDNLIAVNVAGGAAMIKHAGRAMVARNIHGSIICTASAAATRTGLAAHAYTVSKHALLGVVRSASCELGMYGIRVNCVSPLGVATGMSCTIPGIKRFRLDPEFVETQMAAFSNLKGMVLKPKDIAEGALFLASDESACINGHNLIIDGGFPETSNIYPIEIAKTVIPLLQWSFNKCLSTFSSVLSIFVPSYFYSLLFDQNKKVAAN